MYHSFLIHLSADGHLACFHALVIVNSAAMTIVVQKQQHTLQQQKITKKSNKQHKHT